MAIVLGIVFGFLLGFVWRRNRLCVAGTIRDVYLEKNINGIFYVLSIIFVESVIYFCLVSFGVIELTEYSDFSVIAIVLGSIVFGLGCIMAHGCITTSLVKFGDGRLTGLVSLLSFMLFAMSAKKGSLAFIPKWLQAQTVVSDSLVTKMPITPLFIVIPIAIIVLFFSFKSVKTKKKVVEPPSEFTGIRHAVFEKKWSKPLSFCLVGVILGFAWLASNATGRNGSFGMTGPIISWLNYFVNGEFGIDWAGYSILGIILGSLVASLGNKEYSLTVTDAISMLWSFIGGACMGLGSVVAQGCLMGNGLVGTATLSVKAWIALVSICLGIWIGAFLFYKTKRKGAK